MSIVYKSLPGLPATPQTPAIRVVGQDLELQRLDPSVRELADVMVKQMAGLEQRMDQRLAMLEHRQSNALEAIAAHLNMNSAIAAHLNANPTSKPVGIKANSLEAKSFV